MIKVKNYGWKPSRPDIRDHKFTLGSAQVSAQAVVTLPTSVDLRKQCPSVYDQSELGSCTANAGGALGEFLMIKLKKKVYMPARLAIYYWERLLENTVNEDSGASLRDVVKVMATKGVPDESMMPYDITKFTQAPSQQVANFAAQHKIGQYLSISQNLKSLRTCLANGYPFIFGFSVYDSFESDTVAKTGVLNMPKRTEGMLGGHAVMAVGYNDNSKCFIIRNSWGASWGQKGYFTMPYAYMINPDLADDFWTSYTIV